MMQICPKCGYERKLSDGDPDWQCPHCGVAYCKAVKNSLEPRTNLRYRKKAAWYKPFALLLIMLLLLIVGYYRKIHSLHSQIQPPVAIESINSSPLAVLAKDPIQIMLEGKIPAFEKNGYSLTPLARFELAAKVLSKQNYWLGRTADLAPTDLALGWGSMATPELLEKVSITQSNRWYFWYVARDFTQELGHEISSHSSNIHIIPANPVVAEALSSVETGQIIYIKGYLIEANANDGWKWRSSLSREDTGDGACELVWAEELRVR